jgi:hypothetical protein
MRRLCFLVVRGLYSFDQDGLHRTRRCRAQDGVTLRCVRGGIVPQRFLPMQVEGARR